MSRILQAVALASHNDAAQLPAAAALAALGIVYGDIGTSPLYALEQAAAGGTVSSETVIGVVSLILWTLILIVSLKYAILIMRADNHREGGIVALLALLDVRRALGKSWRASLLIVGLIGAALLYGDGVITPAISALSAIEGLKLDAPRLTPLVVPISLAILVGLFLVQRNGTAFIANIFWSRDAAVVHRHRSAWTIGSWPPARLERSSRSGPPTRSAVHTASPSRC